MDMLADTCSHRNSPGSECVLGLAWVLKPKLLSSLHLPLPIGTKQPWQNLLPDLCAHLGAKSFAAVGWKQNISVLGIWDDSSTSMTNAMLRLSNANLSHSTCRVLSEQEPEIAHLGAQLNCQSRKMIQREENANR